MFDDSLPNKLKTLLKKQINPAELKFITQQVLAFPKMNIISIVKNLKNILFDSFYIFTKHSSNIRASNSIAQIKVRQCSNIIKIIKQIILNGEYFIQIIIQGICGPCFKLYAKKWTQTKSQIKNQNDDENTYQKVKQLFRYFYQFLIWFAINFSLNPYCKINIKSPFRSLFQSVPFIKIDSFIYFSEKDKIQYAKMLKQNLSKQIFYDNSLKFLNECFQKEYHFDEEFVQTFKRLVQTRDITFISCFVFVFQQNIKPTSNLASVIQFINVLMHTGQIQVIFLINQNLLINIFQYVFRTKQPNRKLQNNIFQRFILWMGITKKVKLSTKIYQSIFENLFQFEAFKKEKNSSNLFQADVSLNNNICQLNRQKFAYFSYDPEQYQKVEKIQNMRLTIQKQNILIDKIRQQSMEISLSSNKGSNSWSKSFNSQQLQQQSRVQENKIVNSIYIESVFDQKKNGKIQKSAKKYEELLMDQLKEKQKQEQNIGLIHQKIAFQNKIHKKIYNMIKQNSNRQSVQEDKNSKLNFNNTRNQGLQHLKQTANFNVGSSLRDTGKFKANSTTNLNIKQKQYHKKSVLNILKQVESQNRSPSNNNAQDLKTSLDQQQEKQYFLKYGKEQKQSNLQLNSDLKVIAQRMNNKYKSHRDKITLLSQQSEDFLKLQSELKKCTIQNINQNMSTDNKLSGMKLHQLIFSRLQRSPITKNLKSQQISEKSPKLKINNKKSVQSFNQKEPDLKYDKKIDITSVQGYEQKLIKLLYKSSCLLLKNQVFQLGLKRCQDKFQLYFCPVQKLLTLQCKLLSKSYTCLMFQNRFANLFPHKQIKFQIQKIPQQNSQIQKDLSNQKSLMQVHTLKILCIWQNNRKQIKEQFLIDLPITFYSNFKHLQFCQKQFKQRQKKTNLIYKTQWVQGIQSLIKKKKQYLQKLFPKIFFDEKETGFIKLEYKQAKYWIWVYFVYKKFKIQAYVRNKNNIIAEQELAKQVICQMTKLMIINKNQ